MPEVSVIIPNYNHASFLIERIESVLRQTYTDFELIILDDASTDNSHTIIETYSTHPKVSHIAYNETNSGSPFRQWRKGVELAKGDWVWIAESDDYAHADFLLETMAKAVKCKKVALVYCDSFIIDNSTTDQKQSKYANQKNIEFNTTKWLHSYSNTGEQEINESLKWQCVINNVSAVLFNRTRLLKEIPNVIEYRYHGDWLIYIRMAINGKIAYIPQPLNSYREHEKNHSKSEDYNKYSKIEYFRILEYLLQENSVTDKKKLFLYFIQRYIGFGFLKDNGLGKNGIYESYCKINRPLARKVLFQLLINKLKRK